jgi:hypothetical protein
MMDEHRAFRRPPPSADQLDGTMFDLSLPSELMQPGSASEANLRAIDVRVPAPFAPGSATSEDAADERSLPKRQQDHRKVMRALAARHPRPVSRDEIHEATAIPIATLCAILSDRELRGLYLEAVNGACRSRAKPTLKVDGYRLNDAGLKKFRSIRRAG